MLDRTLCSELLDATAWALADQERRLEISRLIEASLAAEFSFLGEAFHASSQVPISTFRHLSTGMTFSLIPGGKFIMGLTGSEKELIRSIDGASENVKIVSYYPDAMEPFHEVEISPLLVAQTPVLETVARNFGELDEIPGRPDFDVGPGAPFMMNFREATSLAESLGFRLLSESECEYCTRANEVGLFYFGDELPGHSDLELICQLDFSSLVNTRFACNAFGLFGLAVGTFCRDAWHPNYVGAPQDGCPWIDSGESPVMVIRGGGTALWPWVDSGEWLTLPSAMRIRSDSVYEGVAGLRLARSVVK